MKISIFAESIKRLYQEGKVTELKIVELFLNGKITEEEKKYILDNNLDVK